MAAVLLLTMRGTPFIYYGEEIGMPNVEIPADRKRDPVGRDGCRTPMQWNASRNGGFTTASEAWLPLGDCAAINVDEAAWRRILDAVAVSAHDSSAQDAAARSPKEHTAPKRTHPRTASSSIARRRVSM